MDAALELRRGGFLGGALCRALKAIKDAVPEIGLIADVALDATDAAGVDQLPDFLRQVIVLAYYQGLKYREVAEILEIPVGTVKSRLHAAILKLNEAWYGSHPTGAE